MNFSPDSRFMRLCGSFVSLVRINLLWLLCSLPLFTVGASTAAMVSALTAFRADDECGAKVFFRAFRTHFRQATVLWLLMAFLGCMLALDYRIVVHLAFPVRMAVIVVICFCALALILVSGLIFPLLVRFPGTLRDTVINAVLLSIAHLRLPVAAVRVFSYCTVRPEGDRKNLRHSGKRHSGAGGSELTVPHL